MLRTYFENILDAIFLRDGQRQFFVVVGDHNENEADLTLLLLGEAAPGCLLEMSNHFLVPRSNEDGCRPHIAF